MMKDCVLVPWVELDALAHGDSESTLDRVTSWLRNVKDSGMRFVILPKSLGPNGHYCQALAGKTFRRLAGEQRLTVLRQKRIPIAC